MTNEPKVILTVRLNPDTYAAVKQAAAAHGVSLTRYVEEALATSVHSAGVQS